jgi:acyl-CoA thioesterase
MYTKILSLLKSIPVLHGRIELGVDRVKITSIDHDERFIQNLPNKWNERLAFHHRVAWIIYKFMLVPLVISMCGN